MLERSPEGLRPGGAGIVPAGKAQLHTRDGRKGETDGKVVSRVVRPPGPPLPPFSRRPTNNHQKINRRASGFRDPGQVRDAERELSEN